MSRSRQLLGLLLERQRQQIVVVGPDNVEYRATFDGYAWLGRQLGAQPQITLLDPTPDFVKGSTTYASSLREKGYTPPSNFPSLEEWESQLNLTPDKSPGRAPSWA
jgi:hypothetical protein